MDTKSQTMWASVLEIVVGAWVMLVPAFTSVTGGALVSVLTTGGLIVLAGLVQLFWENVLPSWVDGIAAIWLFISPFVYHTSTAVTWNLVVAAVAAIIIAWWDGVEVSKLQEAHQ